MFCRQLSSLDYFSEELEENAAAQQAVSHVPSSPSPGTSRGRLAPWDSRVLSSAIAASRGADHGGGDDAPRYRRRAGAAGNGGDDGGAGDGGGQGAAAAGAVGAVGDVGMGVTGGVSSELNGVDGLFRTLQREAEIGRWGVLARQWGARGSKINLALEGPTCLGAFDAITTAAVSCSPFPATSTAASVWLSVDVPLLQAPPLLPSPRPPRSSTAAVKSVRFAPGTKGPGAGAGAGGNVDATPDSSSVAPPPLVLASSSGDSKLSAIPSTTSWGSVLSGEKRVGVPVGSFACCRRQLQPNVFRSPPSLQDLLDRSAAILAYKCTPSTTLPTTLPTTPPSALSSLSSTPSVTALVTVNQGAVVSVSMGQGDGEVEAALAALNDMKGGRSAPSPYTSIHMFLDLHTSVVPSLAALPCVVAGRGDTGSTINCKDLPRIPMREVLLLLPLCEEVVAGDDGGDGDGGDRGDSGAGAGTKERTVRLRSLLLQLHPSQLNHACCVHAHDALA